LSRSRTRDSDCILGDDIGDVGQYAGDVGQYAGDVGQYAGDLGKYSDCCVYSDGD